MCWQDKYPSLHVSVFLCKIGHACIFLHTHHCYIWSVFWQWYAKPTGDTGAGCIHLQVGHFYSHEKTLAIRDTRDMTVIPHSHTKQQSPHTSRWLCLKTNLGIKYTCHKERLKETIFIEGKDYDLIRGNLWSKYSVLHMKFAQIHRSTAHKQGLWVNTDSYSIQAAGGNSQTHFSDFSMSNCAD